MLIFTISSAELCVFCVAVSIWLKSEKAKPFRKGSDFHFTPSPPTSSAEQSDAWQRVTVSRHSAISVVKQDKLAVLQVLLSNSPSHYDTRLGISFLSQFGS